ncbi:MAG: DUF932 domain-containing protein [Planctomycetia bacterium]|nr:DUF932 domain-containing protein [Planctomycetia bacterium]
MVNLTRAHHELFRRAPDEQFTSLDDLWQHCHDERRFSTEKWQLPQRLEPRADGDTILLSVADGEPCRLNDWSFSQLCRMSGVSKDTIGRLSSDTAGLALREVLPRAAKPVQLLAAGQTVRSLHGVAYTRLWNADLMDVVRNYAGDFQPPQIGVNGATGLYCGEQDLFAFLIDPAGWTEIEGEAFAPGFFVWNSEVGRRSLGIQTFWFQAVCQNHIVWDATEVVEFSRKHTASVQDGLNEIARRIAALTVKRDARRDGFVRAIRSTMTATLGTDADEAAKALLAHGIPRGLAKEALDIAQIQGRFTVFAIVDALTKLTQKMPFAGDRVELDQKAASLLALAV